MPITIEQARIEWETENPFPLNIDDNGVVRETTQAEYDAMADEKAVYWKEAVDRQEIVDDYELRKQQFIAGMTQLDTNLAVIEGRIANSTALTAAELRIGMRDLYKAVIWLGRRYAEDHPESGT